MKCRKKRETTNLRGLTSSVMHYLVLIECSKYRPSNKKKKASKRKTSKISMMFNILNNGW